MKRYVYKVTISDKRKSFIITRKEITNENDYLYFCEHNGFCDIFRKDEMETVNIIYESYSLNEDNAIRLIKYKIKEAYNNLNENIGLDFLTAYKREYEDKLNDIYEGIHEDDLVVLDKPFLVEHDIIMGMPKINFIKSK